MGLTRSERKTALIITGSLLLFFMTYYLRDADLWFYDESHHLIWHTILEFFSIFISYSIFMQAWYLLEKDQKSPILFGMLFFCVGSFDLAHTLLYKGMPFIDDAHSVTRATWFWILARLTESLGLAAILLSNRHFTDGPRNRPLIFVIGISLVALLIPFIILSSPSLPILVQEGIGVTSLKIYLEYFISFLHLINVIILLRYYLKQKSENILSIVTGSFYILIAELVFTMYTSVHDLENMLGHICKAVGYFYLMKGIFLPEFNKVIEEKERAKNEWKKTVGLLQEHEKKLTKLVIQAHEEERKLVSRELHDGIGQALYAIAFSINMLKRNQSAGLVQELEGIQEMADNALQEVRGIASRLRPSVLDDLGLLPALRAYAEQYESTYGIRVELTTHQINRRYPAEIETTLYRICQEALTNAAKYAQTDRIRIVLHGMEDHIYLFIEDFGTGFDVQAALHRPDHGIGLYSMKERVTLLNGQLEIRSETGKGTQIGVTIPFGAEIKSGFDNHPGGKDDDTHSNR